MKAQRKTHKERSQPAKRKKLGLLEKRGEVLLPWLAVSTAVASSACCRHFGQQ
jgi:hypothetical protein